MIRIILKKLFVSFTRVCVRIYMNKLKWHIDKIRIEEQNKKILSKAIVGKGVRINGDIVVKNPGMVILGNNVHIGSNAFFSAMGGLCIGDNTHISRNVTIYTNNHNYEGEALPFDDKFVDKPVFIGKNVWIGMNVSITPGVTIGDGAIIGMGTVVSKDVPPFAIVGSEKYRILKFRDKKHYFKVLQNERFGGVNGKLLKKRDVKLFARNGKEMGGNLFFIVSTGRAGSKSIAAILSQHPEITCRHEPNGQLIRLSTEYIHKVKSYEQVKEEIKKMYIDMNTMINKYYGESDQKSSNLIEILAELFPNAKFIWLIRNGIDSVNSMFSRGWFDNLDLGLKYPMQMPDSDLLRREEFSIYSEYRIQADKIGVMSSEDWKEMTAFERNCWYLSFWNSMIEEKLNKLSADRWINVKLEDIAKASDRIISFLGCSKYHFKTVKVNKARSFYRLTKKDDWTEEQRAAYVKWCVPLMKKWYAI